jgi:hypothetical protein
MTPTRLVCAGLLTAALLRAGVATASPGAEEEDGFRPLLAMGAGAATSVVALTGGTMVVARSKERDVRNAGLLGAQTGLCFSPIVAHAVVGELGRGLVWSLLPLAADAGMATLIGFYPNLITRAPPLIQYAMFASLTVSVFGSTLGVLDAGSAGERRRAAAARGLSSLRLTPIFDRHLTGAVIAGAL